MSEESINDAHFSEIDDIHVAADLLRRMLLELEDLEVDNSRLHFAFSLRGLTAVSAEWRLMCTALNLKRMHRMSWMAA